MKINMTIRILENISQRYHHPLEQRTFDKAIAALKYCEEQGLTYYIKEKRYGKIYIKEKRYGKMNIE